MRYIRTTEGTSRRGFITCSCMCSCGGFCRNAGLSLKPGVIHGDEPIGTIGAYATIVGVGPRFAVRMPAGA